MCSNFQGDLERRLDPEQVDLLIEPIARLWAKPKVVVPEQGRGNEPHLVVSKTATALAIDRV